MAVAVAVAAALAVAVAALSLAAAAPPNIVLLFADDLGYGDLSCFGHPTSSTAHLDSLSATGLRLTGLYTAASVCSPSRAALLTGRYPSRSGVYPGVFYPDSRGGLPLNETTIAELLRTRGYATAMVGKWHLGYGLNGSFLPLNQGFQQWLGVPYSHDQGPCQNLTCFPPDTRCFGLCDQGVVPLPVFQDWDIVEQPVTFPTLTARYNRFSTDFIHRSASARQPFFLYYASHHTHYPQFASAHFTGKSGRGAFGDALMEFDGSVGLIVKSLRDAGVENNTFIFFTSDNGPELMRMSRGGTAGLLKCGKATTYEGGMREPGIAYWPGKIPPGVSHELMSTLDLLPTIAKITGAELPRVPLDGYDMSNMLFNSGQGRRRSVIYYPISAKRGLFAIRLGHYKAHYYTQGSIKSGTTPDHDCHFTAPLIKHDPPLVFDLETDPSENYPLTSAGFPGLADLLRDFAAEKASFEAGMQFGESQIELGGDPKLQPCAVPGCTPHPSCCVKR
ncbi:arylsulfatase A [Callorhinchus milii]|uniref:Arylsulfatase A n=1 Tax=Callorhinchus milii TaxID=7868 RepID=A0A4W3H1X6_CALMI|nr:arylsulfatase A [Callorhinchus milii]|eukprot:gi/632985841/ref/XP_007909907.1/ PREDICTED: arylsulfatase A [Callorhinchus milii]